MSRKRSGPPGRRQPAVRVKTARRRKSGSTRWLQRHLNDPYVAAAQHEGYRSRAAFKLIELDDKLHFLAPAKRVVDLGAAPGGWSQVAVERVRPSEGRGAVVAVDRVDMEPVAGARVLRADLMEEDASARVLAALGGAADVVLSDMAPATTGHAATDHLRIVALAECALDFAEAVLAPGGVFVVKVFQGGAEGDMLARLKAGFAKLRHVKPPASRKESSETYVVASGFRKA